MKLDEAHLKSEIRNRELDSNSLGAAVQFDISDLGFEMGFRPISHFLLPASQSIPSQCGLSLSYEQPSLEC